MNIDVGNRLIFALDVPDSTAAWKLVSETPNIRWYKVGLELFVSSGQAAVRALTSRGRNVMLDLKLHDIPETVYRTAKVLGDMGAMLITVHTGGGREMLEAAVSGVKEGNSGAGVLGVTVLTSINETLAEEIGLIPHLGPLVTMRARVAEEAGCAGVVASPQEATAIKIARRRDDFLVVTPGIRPAGTNPGDQKRVATPREARNAGADMVVVGRPIRDADDMYHAAQQIIEDLV